MHQPNTTITTRRGALALLTSICLAIAPAALGHGGMEHVQGKIAKIGDNSITVTTTAGKTQEVLVDAKTTYSKASKPIKKTDLQVGDRVAVHAEEVNEKLTARTVEIGAATPAKTAAKTATKPATK